MQRVSDLSRVCIKPLKSFLYRPWYNFCFSDFPGYASQGCWQHVTVKVLNTKITCNDPKYSEITYISNTNNCNYNMHFTFCKCNPWTQIPANQPPTLNPLFSPGWKWAGMLVETGKAFVDPSAMMTQMREGSNFCSLPPLMILSWWTHLVITKHPEDGHGIAQMGNTTIRLITF